MAVYDKKHHEIPDPRPLSLPAGTVQPESLESLMARMIRNRDYMKHFEGKETWEEADDFDCPGEEDILSPYEQMMVPLTPEEIGAPSTRSEPLPVTAQKGEDVQTPKEPKEKVPIE